MNSILVCLFVFTVGSLAAKIPTDVDKGETPEANTESLLKKNLDFSDPCRDTSLITKRSVRKSDRWQKANSSPVCFGAKNNHFGKFYAPSSGRLAAVKLVHLYGYVSCDIRRVSHWSYWGCGDHSSAGHLLNVVITTSTNHIILPPTQFMQFAHKAGKWSLIGGYNSHSPEIILSFFSDPYWVRSGKELRLWYGEDMVDYADGDNGGRVCADVYALYV